MLTACKTVGDLNCNSCPRGCTLDDRKLHDLTYPNFRIVLYIYIYMYVYVCKQICKYIYIYIITYIHGAMQDLYHSIVSSHTLPCDHVATGPRAVLAGMRNGCIEQTVRCIPSALSRCCSFHKSGSLLWVPL